LAIEKSFLVRNGCAGHLQISILPQFLAIELHFVRKGCAGHLQIAILPQFLAIEPHFVRKSCDWTPEIAILPQFLAFWWSNLISCEGVAFRGVSLALPCAFKREIEKKERARGQEGKRECEDGKM